MSDSLAEKAQKAQAALQKAVQEHREPAVDVSHPGYELASAALRARDAANARERAAQSRLTDVEADLRRARDYIEVLERNLATEREMAEALTRTLRRLVRKQAE